MREGIPRVEEGTYFNPILIVLEIGQRYTVHYDASKNGFRCVLMQSERVVSYGSWQLKNHEQSYPTHDMELHIYDEQFEVFSNHKSLKYIFA